MKFPENIQEVTLLQPDYLGFIFYEKSPRNFEGKILAIPSTIKKTGVFVDTSIDFILQKVKQYDFQAIQLHGNESAAYCQDLKDTLISDDRPHRFLKPVRSSEDDKIKIWKVFSIKDTFDFDVLKPYEGIVDCFLFDTKGKEKGGNGYTFDWSVLKNYSSSTPFILSGGIGLEETDSILSFLKGPESNYLYAIDVNSRFEIEPGLKNIEKLKEFKNLLSVDR
ncbi:phosphoribosylanthranilate isomerase [Aquimarina muelleri]|nr:phosphoribosylanthranilate isomerase [Aquimarina muelleri]MCX2762458.1 phosphoribosylanthranilate isomerase [Aquimarina muelleri]